MNGLRAAQHIHQLNSALKKINAVGILWVKNCLACRSQNAVERDARQVVAHLVGNPRELVC